jgi:hypothetical protein
MQPLILPTDAGVVISCGIIRASDGGVLSGGMVAKLSGATARITFRNSTCL